MDFLFLWTFYHFDFLHIDPTPRTCQFPFEYKEKTYYECVHGLFGDYDYWCPTELDPDNQPYNWGRCGENCPSSNFRNGDSGDSTAISPKFASKLYI